MADRILFLETPDIQKTPVGEKNEYTAAEKQKLSGIEAGAQKNTVDSVNGKTGPVTLDAADVGALPSNTPIPAAVTEQTVAGWGFTKNTGTYSKPVGGIPASDLAASVIPTVPQMATDPNMSDWTSGKTVDAAALKVDFSHAVQQIEGAYDLANSKADRSDIPTAVSELTNDSGYQTASDVQTAIAGKVNAADVYTKTEVDQKLVGAMDYKGTKATVAELPTSGNATGDVWHITADGSEWAWNGSAWEELGSAVDLSGYRTASAQDSVDAAQDAAIAAKYTKPASGIPASDLADGVIPIVPSASATAPLMDGTAAVGTSAAYARADHVHPSDTTRVWIDAFGEEDEQGNLLQFSIADGTDTIDMLSERGVYQRVESDMNAYRAASIPMGHLNATSTATVMKATVPGITELRDGVCMWLQNGVITSASGFTINVNNLGAKPCYNSLAAATRATTVFNVNYTMLLIYNSTRVDGGCWDIVYGVDTNTTYTPPKLGFGYGTCTTAAATAAKTASISSYALTTGGIVSIKFDHDVPAGATLNISSKGAKAIYHRGAAITDGVIKAGDTATFVYSTYYHLIGIDRQYLTLADLPIYNGGVT